MRASLDRGVATGRQGCETAGAAGRHDAPQAVWPARGATIDTPAIAEWHPRRKWGESGNRHESCMIPTMACLMQVLAWHDNRNARCILHAIMSLRPAL